MSKSVFADDLHIKGNVTSKGDVQLNGVVNGEISARTLWLEKDSSIKGSATAEKVVIGGNIDSNVYGNSVKLKSSANVQSEVMSNSLSVDEDACFNGTSNCVENSSSMLRQFRVEATEQWRDVRPLRYKPRYPTTKSSRGGG